MPGPVEACPIPPNRARKLSAWSGVQEEVINELSERAARTTQVLAHKSKILVESSFSRDSDTSGVRISWFPEQVSDILVSILSLSSAFPLPCRIHGAASMIASWYPQGSPNMVISLHATGYMQIGSLYQLMLGLHRPTQTLSVNLFIDSCRHHFWAQVLLLQWTSSITIQLHRAYWPIHWWDTAIATQQAMCCPRKGCCSPSASVRPCPRHMVNAYMIL